MKSVSKFDREQTAADVLHALSMAKQYRWQRVVEALLRMSKALGVAERIESEDLRRQAESLTVPEEVEVF